MSKTLQAVRGMNDILPSQTPYWHFLETNIRQLVHSYGYHEVRLPIVESTHLFKRTIGEVTDIVEKEMYTFDDRNGDSLSLRPEGTAGCVRAGIEHGLLFNQIQRLWYLGPMFRHERPQKGRYRQFYQFGMEAFGMEGPGIDAEQIFFMQRLFQQIGIRDRIRLEINTLGHYETREKYRETLVAYFSRYEQDLDEDCRRRLTTNPLRILDSKNPDLQAMINEAPVMTDIMDRDAQAHFEQFCALLDANQVDYVINPRMVRGLDYYGLTIYEWITDALGSQGTVCAGGRYNKLVEQLGGKASPAVGFAMGLERVVNLIEAVYEPQVAPDVFLILAGASCVQTGMVVAEQLRFDLPQLQVVVNCDGGSLKSQFKRADKSGAKLALILGEDEMKMGTCAIKTLRDDRAQMVVPLQELLKTILTILAE